MFTVFNLACGSLLRCGSTLFDELIADMRQAYIVGVIERECPLQEIKSDKLNRRIHTAGEQVGEAVLIVRFHRLGMW